MKDILNNKKMLYVGIAVLVIGIAFAIGTYAYYSTTINGNASGTTLAYTCTGNNVTDFTLAPFTNAYPGYSATRTISLNASIYTEATINVSSYTNMGAGSVHPNLLIYSDENHTKAMSNNVNTITTTITPGSATSVPLYIYWPYESAEEYSNTVPSATITITCNQGVEPPSGADKFNAYFDNVSKTAGAKRYTGANVDNYVSFNNGELWRIIGIYGNQLKIIKATALAETKAYDADSNVWAGSDLELWLNDETTGYYSTLDSTAKNMIAEGTWNAGAVVSNADTTTSYTSAQATQVTRKVGLLATYEYLYAADPSCHATAGSSYDSGSPSCGSQDWLKPSSGGEWTLSPYSGTASSALYLNSNGYVNGYFVDYAYAFGVRPVVYLKSEIGVISGQGTDTQPYVLG